MFTAIASSSCFYTKHSTKIQAVAVIIDVTLGMGVFLAAFIAFSVMHPASSAAITDLTIIGAGYAVGAVVLFAIIMCSLHVCGLKKQVEIMRLRKALNATSALLGPFSDTNKS